MDEPIPTRPQCEVCKGTLRVPHQGTATGWIACPACTFAKSPVPADRVNHPPHYNAHPSGVECIDIVEHMSFNVGNAIKYLWRADHKADAMEDLRKAAWYINREIELRGKKTETE